MASTMPSANPFSMLSATFDPKAYYGSQELVNFILSRASLPIPSPIELLGLPGMGKSYLLRYIAHPEGALLQNAYALQFPFIGKSHLLFPLLVEFRLLPTNTHPFTYLYQRFHEDYKVYRELLESEHGIKAPEFVVGEPNTPEKAISLLEADIHLLKEKLVRPVFLLDDFHLAFDIEHMNFSQTTRLRPLRDRVAFILVTERSLEKVNPEASGSSFFQMIDKIRFGGLTADEAERLISKPAEESGYPFHHDDVKFVLTLADGHLYLLIRAGSILWSLRERLNIPMDITLAVSAEHEPILLGHLKVEFQRVFSLYWAQLEPIERETLIEVASNQHLDGRNSVLASLLAKGLVKYVPQKKIHIPFSLLFSEFISGVTTPKPNLSDLEAGLFDYLERNASRICSFEELSQNIWKEPFKGSDEEKEALRRRVQVAVSRLRKKLQEHNYADIISVRDQGYRISRTTKKTLGQQRM